jgi:hypothetical protein
MVFSAAGFARVFPEKRLELKSLKRQTKAEEEGPPQEKLMQNLQSKTPYKFKKSYGGTPEPQTPQNAPWLRGPSLKYNAPRKNSKSLKGCKPGRTMVEPRIRTHRI